VSYTCSLLHFQTHNNSTAPRHQIRKRKKDAHRLDSDQNKKKQYSTSVCLVSMAYPSLGGHAVMGIGFLFPFLLNANRSLYILIYIYIYHHKYGLNNLFQFQHCFKRDSYSSHPITPASCLCN